MTRGIQITCLIPAWNEAARIGAVLQAVSGVPGISRVLVIDDGSTDDTAGVARAHGATVLRTPGNMGKTRALALGIAQSRGSHVLLLDADLIGLTATDISALIAPVLHKTAGASVSLRGNSPLIWRMIGLDYISGERVIPRALIARHLNRLTKLPRFGFEVFLNDLLIRSHTPLAVVRWPGVASPSKAAKQGLWRGIRADIAMMGDIFRTISPLEGLRQIIALRQSVPSRHHASDHLSALRDRLRSDRLKALYVQTRGRFIP